MNTITFQHSSTDWPTANAIRREHHYAQARTSKTLRTLAKLKARDMGTVNTPARLIATISWADNIHRDLDNVSLKAITDGLVDAGVIPDDCTCHVVEVVRRLGPKHTKKGSVQVSISLETIEMEAEK